MRCVMIRLMACARLVGGRDRVDVGSVDGTRQADLAGRSVLHQLAHEESSTYRPVSAEYGVERLRTTFEDENGGLLGARFP